MRTIVLKRPGHHAREQYLVTVLDDGSVHVAYRGREDRVWSPPATEVVSDEGDMPTFSFIVSFGLIPELSSFDTLAQADEAWREEIDRLTAEGYSLCNGDEACEGGCARWEEDVPHTPEELYDSGFVTDWNKWELRREY